MTERPRDQHPGAEELFDAAELAELLGDVTGVENRQASRKDPLEDPGPRDESKDLPLEDLAQLARELLNAEEMQRLYPPDHPRPRAALKTCHSCFHHLTAITGAVLRLSPELLLDLSTQAPKGTPSTRALRDVATRLRSQNVKTIVARPEIDADEVATLLPFLAPPKETTGELLLAPESPNLEFEFVGGEDGHEYVFQEDGSQLFASSDRSRDGLVPLDLPPALRQSITQVLSEPRVQRELDQAVESLAAEAPRPGERRELAAVVVDELCCNPQRYLGQSIEQISEDLRLRLRALTEGDSSNATPSPASAMRAVPQEVLDLDLADLWPVDEPATSRREDPLEPLARAASPETAPPLAEAPTEADLAPELTCPQLAELRELGEMPFHGDQLESDLNELTAELEALRIDAEIMASHEGQVFERERDRYLRRLEEFEFDSSADWVDELERTHELLPGPDGKENFLVCALARARRESASRYCEERRRRGDGPEELRPLLRALSAEDSLRALEAITALWRGSSRRERKDWAAEIHVLALAGGALADWADRNPEIFCSSSFLGHLDELPKHTLDALFDRWLGTLEAEGKDRGVPRLGGSTGSQARVRRATGLGQGSVRRQKPARTNSSRALQAALRTLARRPEGEAYVARALEEGTTLVRQTALECLRSCENPRMLQVLTRILDEENESARPDLEAVRHILAALLESRLPACRVLLRRVARERKKVVSFTYQREIRELLDLLRKTKESP